MLAFFGWVVHYLIIMAVLAVCAALGLKIGISLRKKKNVEMTDTVHTAVEDK